MKTLVFATNNQHKLIEISSLISDCFELKSLNDINCFDEIPEEKDTLEGNALDKARYIFEKYGLNCFADDTGLEIEALQGKPGVYSARYAGESRDSNANMNKVIDELVGIENRNARFRTVIALIIDGNEYLLDGIVNGTIIEHKRGDSGFGYDPIFVPNGYDLTFAEMDLTEKNKISHRALATHKLINFLNNYQK